MAHGTMALLTELTSFQIAAFLMENVATFWILTGRIRLNKMMLALAALGYLMNLIFIAALVVIMLSEGLKKKIVNGIRFLIMKLPFGNKKRLGAKMDEIVRDFEDCKLFFKKGSGTCVKSDNSQSDPDYLLVQCSMGSVSCNGRVRQFLWKYVSASDHFVYDYSTSSVPGS